MVYHSVRITATKKKETGRLVARLTGEPTKMTLQPNMSCEFIGLIAYSLVKLRTFVVEMLILGSPLVSLPVKR